METHGLSNSSIYRIWDNMCQRCNNPNNPGYKYWGGRGITICNRWLSFENFYKDMGNPPKGLMFERKDNNGNYEPSNCVWTTRKEQNNNARSNIVIEYNNQKFNLAEWARIIGINYSTLRHRLRIANWSIKKALTKPVKQYKYI